MEVEHKASPDPADRSLDHANLTPHLSLLTHELTFRENAAICALVRERIRSIVTLPYKLEASLKGELLVLNISSDPPISCLLYTSPSPRD